MFERYWRIIRISRIRDEYEIPHYRVDYPGGMFGKVNIVELDTEDALLRLLAETPHKKLKWFGLPPADWLTLEGRLKKC